MQTRQEHFLNWRKKKSVNYRGNLDQIHAVKKNDSGYCGKWSDWRGNFSYCKFKLCSYRKRKNRKPELAGGALLDVGVYPINFASMVLGENLKAVQSSAIFEGGVDILETIIMNFEGNKMATLQSGVREISDRMGSIFGTKGYIQVQNINNPEKITVFNQNHEETASYFPPKQITGYEYEVRACKKALEEGKIECPEMPHAETVRIMEIMDGLRKSWGYEIPEVY